MNVSICMASYNRKELLRATLRSIFSQGKPEVLVVDDGSEDHTDELVNEFPITYFYLDRPYYCNQARAMNLAIRNATKDVVILQSADVEHEGNAIEILSQVPENEWWFAKIRCNNDFWPDRPLYFLCSLHRHHLMEIGGVDEDFTLPGYEDDDLARRLIEKGLVVVYRADVVGNHQDHPRPELGESYRAMAEVYRSKSGVVRNQGRDWGIQ